MSNAAEMDAQEIVMMYMGRVGVLTLGVAVFMRRREPPRLKYPDADVFIG